MYNSTTREIYYTTAVQASTNVSSFTAREATISNLTMIQTNEQHSTITGATGVVNHDYSVGSVWYHSSMSANFTTNITNLPTTENRAYVIVLNLIQGATPYYTSTLQIGGTATTINWANATIPTPVANRFEVESLTIYRQGGTYRALGQYTSFGPA
jgi:hypothetical protein